MPTLLVKVLYLLVEPEGGKLWRLRYKFGGPISEVNRRRPFASS
jgi:hypothetical protein